MGIVLLLLSNVWVWTLYVQQQQGREAVRDEILADLVVTQDCIADLLLIEPGDRGDISEEELERLCPSALAESREDRREDVLEEGETTFHE